MQLNHIRRREMRSHHIRTLGLLVGLIAVLGMASIAAG